MVALKSTVVAAKVDIVALKPTAASAGISVSSWSVSGSCNDGTGDDGASVDGANVAGASVAGASVDGASVAGASVTGAGVIGVGCKSTSTAKPSVDDICWLMAACSWLI